VNESGRIAVATAKPHYTLAPSRKTSDQCIDVDLVACGTKAGVADQKLARFAAGEVENLA
jgi:hypothetical protein